MMTFKVKIENGPTVHLCVQIKDGHIIKTDLKAATEAAFFCTIDSDVDNKNLINKILQWLEDYSTKKMPTFALPYLFSTSTPFEKKVYESLLQINLGQTKSYQDIAQMVGSSQSARAVGNACNKNPLPFFVPCHRVIKKNNSIGGFALPLQIKSTLLAFETL